MDDDHERNNNGGSGIGGTGASMPDDDLSLPRGITLPGKIGLSIIFK